MAVYKRNGIWYIDYYIQVNGKQQRRRESVGPRKDVAEARLKKCRDMIRNGVDPECELTNSSNESTERSRKPFVSEHQETTLQQFMPVFLDLHGMTLSEKMQESYKTSFMHLVPVFGNVCLDGISKISVQTYMANRIEEGACNTTVNKEIRCLTKALSTAVEWGYIDGNPLKGLKVLKEPPERIRYLTKKEYELVLTVSLPHLREIIVFAVGTGMRKSEIFNLTWSEVKFSETSKYGQITVIGKGGKRRHLSMNKTVYDLLIRLYRKKVSNYVFASPVTGGRISDVKRSFTTALKNAGIMGFRFHDLRHTFASWLVMKSVDLYTVQRLLGHADIRTTMRYAHLAPGFLEQEISKIDEILFSEDNSIDAVPECVGGMAV